MSVSSVSSTSASSLPLSTILTLCVSKTQTQAELDAYIKLIRAQSELLANNKNDEAFEAVRPSLSHRMHDCYKDIIASIRVHHQSSNYTIAFVATVDSVPFYFWKSYDELRCSLKWTNGSSTISIDDDNSCKSKGDAMRTTPNLIVDFLFALHDKKINLGKEVEIELNKQKK
jgi:hypothetical protein